MNLRRRSINDYYLRVRVRTLVISTVKLAILFLMKLMVFGKNYNNSRSADGIIATPIFCWKDGRD